MKLQQLVPKLAVLEQRSWDPLLEISGIASDSRRVARGSLFVACRGPHVDGHRFLPEAFEKGAVAAVVEDWPRVVPPSARTLLRVADSREALGALLNAFRGSPSDRMDLIGITGTNGKTTIAYLLYDVLKTQVPSAYLGTMGVVSANRARPLENTTPGCEELYALLADFERGGVRTVAMEVSSHALDQRRVEGLRFKLAVFTQLTAEHLDYHGTMEDYFQAKRRLFRRTPEPEQMLIHQDSGYGRRLLAEFPKAKGLSLEGEADYRAEEIETGFEGSGFTFVGPRGRTRFKTKLPMRHNVANALAALACLDLLGFDPASFRQRLETFPGVAGRLERIEANGFRVFVDYAHTPDAFENILSEARRLRPRRILTLFGCGGDRDPFKRPEMTRIACQYSDWVILTSDNPRTEDPREILRQMRAGLPGSTPPPEVREILDRREAIEELLSLAEPDDAVFILGKGHEDYQILGDEKRHFDDREVVRELLERKSRVAL